MKPFLGVDITEDKNNERFNGEEFAVEKPSEAYAESFEKAAENQLELDKKAKLPLPLRIIQGVTGFVGFILLVGIFKSDVELTEAYGNAPAVFWACGACLAVWFILYMLSKNKAKNTYQSEEGNLTSSRLDTAMENIFAELGVPETAVQTDILSFAYKIKDDEIIPKTPPLGMTPFNNLIYRAYVHNGCLCLTNLDGRNEIPLEEIKEIRTVKKKIILPGWNKEISHNKGEYKKYKLSTDKNGFVHVKPYHILVLEHSGAEWGIYFPSYELPVFESLTGLTAPCI
ncbi:MAG: hypothetical protein IKJ27_06565 [Clostridia bacterium]|nr:hypothetical protein [Clostridia bacterium]